MRGPGFMPAPEYVRLWGPNQVRSPRCSFYFLGGFFFLLLLLLLLGHSLKWKMPRSIFKEALETRSSLSVILYHRPLSVAGHTSIAG